MPQGDLIDISSMVWRSESVLQSLISRRPIFPSLRAWDNRDSWDNVGGGFDNRPSWDNWNKR
ncbi:multiple cyclophane-containing RiPP AmcA [Saccharopolyspora rosea]|uniref:Multiple cyclophane-containing RiPP AmcA n=2 Tax=Saccharopolyspora rosea TaxID=524884 RepID=A0ABW3FYQ8_9PSEU